MKAITAGLILEALSFPLQFAFEALFQALEL